MKVELRLSKSDSVGSSDNATEESAASSTDDEQTKSLHSSANESLTNLVRTLKFAEFSLPRIRRNSLRSVRKLYTFSPLDFYLCLESQVEIIEELENEMQKIYTNDSPCLPAHFIQKDAACVAKYSVDGQFYRARVVESNNVSDAFVHFVDYGNMQCVPFKHIKPLYLQFAELPPVAFKCRLKGVDSRYLEMGCVDKFRQIMLDFEKFEAKLVAVSVPYFDGFDAVLNVVPKSTDGKGSELDPKYLQDTFRKFLWFKD